MVQRGVRGDNAAIKVGEGGNIQDHALLHSYLELSVIIGARVLDAASIGKGAIIGAGAVVRPRTRIPPRSLVLGCPGKVIRAITEQEALEIRRNADAYIMRARRYRHELRLQPHTGKPLWPVKTTQTLIDILAA